jgi:hypothetical protein
MGKAALPPFLPYCRITFLGLDPTPAAVLLRLLPAKLRRERHRSRLPGARHHRIGRACCCRDKASSGNRWPVIFCLFVYLRTITLSRKISACFVFLLAPFFLFGGCSRPSPFPGMHYDAAGTTRVASRFRIPEPRDEQRHVVNVPADEYVDSVPPSSLNTGATMKRIVAAVSLLACSFAASPGAEADKPLIVELWPGQVPDEAGDIGPAQ